jgi:hypothetical protein
LRSIADRGRLERSFRSWKSSAAGCRGTHIRTTNYSVYRQLIPSRRALIGALTVSHRFVVARPPQIARHEFLCPRHQSFLSVMGTSLAVMFNGPDVE